MSSVHEQWALKTSTALDSSTRGDGSKGGDQSAHKDQPRTGQTQSGRGHGLTCPQPHRIPLRALQRLSIEIRTSESIHRPSLGGADIASNDADAAAGGGLDESGIE